MGRLNDPARLAALTRSGLLDRPPAERLARLVRTTVDLFRADSVQVNMLDEAHQHHVAQWPEPPLQPIDVRNSGCQHVVTSEKPVAVADTSVDPVMCALPWAETYRGYLAAPVPYDGQVIGALCVRTLKPRDWASMEVLALEAMARLVGQSLD